MEELATASLPLSATLVDVHRYVLERGSLSPGGGLTMVTLGHTRSFTCLTCLSSSHFPAHAMRRWSHVGRAALAKGLM